MGVPAPRKLPYPVDNSAANSSNISGEPECSGSSAVLFPDNPDERTLVPFWLSLNEYNLLANCVDVGADIAYSTDAQRVLYIWLRNTRCADMICDFITGCTTDALGLAFGASQYQEIQDKQAEQQAQYEADYDGTPSSVNPDTFDTNFDGSGDENDRLVLCSSTEAFVKMFAAQKAQQLKLILGGSAAILAVVTLLAPGLGWILASGVYIAIGAALLVTGVTYSAAIAALEDEGALEDVSCCLKSSLEGVAVTEVNWNAALTGCSFDTGSNAEIVREFVIQSLAENYLTFLNVLGTAKHTQDIGELLSCSCFDWTHDIDFTGATMPDGWTVGVGTHVPGDGISGVSSGGGFSVARATFTPAGSFIPDTMIIRSSGYPSGSFGQVFSPALTGATFAYNFDIQGAPGTDVSVAGLPAAFADDDFTAGIVWNADPSGEFLTGLSITGSGFDPFA